MRLEGYSAQKITFSNTIYIKQIGHAVLTVPDPSDPSVSDIYIITLPSLHIEGLLYGAPYIELDGLSYIVSSTGYTARIEYSGKGWLSGKKNSVSAVLYQSNIEKDILYSAKGQWNGVIEFHRGPTKSHSNSTMVDIHNAQSALSTTLSVHPIEEQHPLESRKAWRKVAHGIINGNMELVGNEKTKIENAQRAARVREKEQGITWNRRYFLAKESLDEVLASLCNAVGLSPEDDADKTGGIWRFDAANAQVLRTQVLSREEEARIYRELLGQEPDHF